MAKYSFLFNSIAVIFVLVSVRDGNAFNLSPKPNIVLREPTAVNNGMPKMRSSYFGFSLNLKQNSILIGAPRAQSTLETQRNINETGAIYKCTFDKSPTGNCSVFVFDKAGSHSEPNGELTWNNEKKDYQWLGASMDGSDSENDKFVVCAPRLMSDQSSNLRKPNYLLHGVCFWTTNTSSSEPLNVQKIAPLRIKKSQMFKVNENNKVYYYSFGEQGVSVHITENGEEILIGAPGIFGWSGSVIRHKGKNLIDEYDLSRRKRQQTNGFDSMEYSSDIPNPLLSNQEFDSYFGYAVSSGYFDGNEKTKLLYVASAPKANMAHGAVYIFDIVDSSGMEKNIKIYHTFVGHQLGEYFGYSLLTEDFNNDGYTDIVIAAPFNSKAGTHENGAVYIYKNEGGSSNFALHAVLRTDYELDGRFGTTISKVGDINQDGFNDLIVAAPFEDDGALYIYYGSSNGLREKYSQKINAPHNKLQINQMFGHGLSKGADIDDNNYLDIAVGSPNTETVYIYKSYPVIRVNATITPFSQEIQTSDRSLKFNVCWLYESSFPIEFDVHFNATVKLDGQLGRAVFQDKQNQFEINSKITSDEQCVQLEAFVTFSIVDIFRPIELEMAHHVLNDISNNDNSNNDNNALSETQAFCETCVAVNPNDSKSIKSKVVFSTGCKNARCIADLKINSSLENVPSLPYILGSSSSITIAYSIENSGETAYLAQIRIVLPESDVFFTKTPSTCKLDETAPNSNVMECDLKNGIPMFRGDKTSILVSVDMTKLDSSELVIRANVFSTGDEQNDVDNEDERIIPLQKFSKIEILGDSSSNQIVLQSEVERENVSHTFEIRNNGPSNIKSIDIFVSLPVSLINPWTLEKEILINTDSLTMESIYDGQHFDIEWSQNKATLDFSSEEREPSNPAQADLTDETVSTINEMNLAKNSIGIRSRRSLENFQNSYFNSYLQKVIERNPRDSSAKTDQSDDSLDLFSVNDRILSNLPSNRTIYFDCNESNQEHCLVGRFRMFNFKANNAPLLLTLNFSIDMTKMAKIMSGKRDILVIRTSVEVGDIFDDDTTTVQVVQNQPFTVISKFVDNSTPLWIYILSIVFGLLSLIFISYALFRFGFFTRGKRDELVKLKRQSELRSYWVVPGDGVDDDDD